MKVSRRHVEGGVLNVGSVVISLVDVDGDVVVGMWKGGPEM